MSTPRFSSGLSLLTLSIATAAAAHAEEVASAPAEPPAAASDANTAKGGLAIDEIVVTARRVAENLQDVPVAVTAIGEETLRQERIIDVTSLQRVTPSLTVTTTSRGPSTPVYMIRGQRAFSVNTLTEPAVTVYFADVGQSLPTGTNLSLYDLSSVQVLKGPQGTLFGRNTTGGAILFTPAAPTDDFNGYAQATSGSDDLMDFEGAINIPVTDTLAVRAAGKIQRRDGYLTNPVRGDDAGDLHAESVRLSVGWQPTDAFQTTTIGTYFKDDVQSATKLYLIDPTRIPFPAPLRAVVTGQYQQALAQLDALDDDEFVDANPQYSRNEVWSAQNSSTLNLAVGFADELAIKNIAGYRDVRSRYRFNTEGSPLAVVDYPGSINARQFSDELQLLGKKGNLEFQMGLFYYDLKSEDAARSFQFASLAPLPLPPPIVFPTVSLQSYEAHNKSYAGYAHFNYTLDSLLDGLSVSGGARLTRDEREVTYHNRSAAGFTPTTFRCTLLNNALVPDSDSACATSADTEFEEPTYDISLNYAITDDLLVYLAHRHGYRSGGFNTNPPSVALIPTFTFDPETIDDFEVGLKTDFSAGSVNGRLNLAAFRSNYEDIQRSSNVTLPGSTTISSRVTNAAKAHVTGGEVEFTLQPLEGLTLTLNGALIDAEYDEWDDTYLVAGVPTQIDISDSKFALVPKEQINASITYELPLDQSFGDISLRGSYYHQSAIETGEINTSNCGPNGLYAYCNQRLGALPNYHLFNARLDWRDVAGKGFDLALFVDNVTDEFYRPDGLNLLGVLGLMAETIGPPRTFGVELRVPFGSSRY